MWERYNNHENKKQKVHFSTCSGPDAYTACGRRTANLLLVVPGLSRPKTKVTCKKCIRELKHRTE